ncbi:hypothetical protein ACRYJU_03955 [Alloalcanivorax xenomutans]|uniref:hypothetical protein n=1 Tax=Alloalcanivorax xenomutans TaxID=1094342 RepID=UPI000BCE7A0C|nr:hypothetical protein [Alloalcanivorax xenomutans]SOB90690.1 hypothetical protein SAMN05877962_101200 [Alloalcanivorax xenomutans]
MAEIATYLGTMFGLVGLIAAYWQNRQKANLEKVIRANSWFNYQRSNNSNGTLQKAMRLYKERHEGSLDPDVIEELARADAFGQEVHKESVRQIHFSEPSFKKENIESWVSEGKISEGAKPLFLQLSEEGARTDWGQVLPFAFVRRFLMSLAKGKT